MSSKSGISNYTRAPLAVAQALTLARPSKQP